MASVVARRIRRIASQPPQNVSGVRAAIRVIDYARTANVNIPPDLVSDASASMQRYLQDTAPADRDEYWRLLSCLLSYESFLRGTKTDRVSILKSLGFPVIGPNDHGKWIGDKRGVAFVDITVILDANPRERGAVYASGRLLRDYENVLFLTCAITYRGGDIKLHNVQFIDCDFDIYPRSPSENDF